MSSVQNPIIFSEEDPVADYKKQFSAQVQGEEITDDDVLEDNYQKLAAAARATVWKLLFDEPWSKQKQEKAAKLLEVHKADACFYGPYEYNEWVVTLRDELLKWKMLDFWRYKMVARELGPCWAKDSDYFDDMDDPEPEAFYKHAGCVAPFSKSTAANGEGSAANSAELPVNHEQEEEESGTTSTAPTVVSLEKPAEDYNNKLQFFLETKENEISEVFQEARDIIWKLLFDEPNLSEENFKKAAALLELYKTDACFYSPYGYNDWLPQLRDKLFERKYFDFWKKIIVDKKCGLCWYRDSDFFDDQEDPAPNEFYKSGDHLMN